MEAVVGAAGARRRSARRRSAARRARPRTRAARPTRARSAPGRRSRLAARERRPVADPERVAGDEATRAPRARPARAARRAARSRRRTRTRRRTASRARRAAPSGRICHQDCPAACSQSTKRYASGPRRPPGSEVGCSRMPLERGSVTRFSLAVRLETGHRSNGRAADEATSRTDPDPGRRPAGRLRPLSRASARSATASTSRRDDLPRRPRDARRGGALPSRAGERRWREAPLTPVGNDRWDGLVRRRRVRPLAVHRVEAWVDRFASWRHEIRRKADAGQEDLSSELAEGAVAARPSSRVTLEEGAGRDTRATAREMTWLASARGRRRPRARPLRRLVRALPALVGRLRGRRGGAAAARRARLRRRLPAADPPDRRRTNRKGANNALSRPSRATPAARGRSAAPRAATRRSTRSSARVERLRAARRAAAASSASRSALDFAIQCSPDHPWLKEHPEWFHRRPDGTLKYAENPPKRYQDIYNVNFDCEDWQGLWEALRDVVLFWVDARRARASASTTRTRSRSPFWEWLIREVRAVEPGGDLPRRGVHAAGDDDDARQGRLQPVLHVLHLEEHALGAGRVHAASWPAGRRYYRPNFFANTPDILHEYLQEGGRPAFEARLVLAATLSPTYGIYSGYEHFENVPGARGQRGVPRLGEVRGEGARARRAAAAARAAAERDPAREPGAPALRERRASSRRRASTCSRTRSAGRATPSSCVVNLDPIEPRARASRSSRRDSACRRRSPVRDLLTGATVRVAHRPQLRPPRPGPEPHPAGEPVSACRTPPVASTPSRCRRTTAVGHRAGRDDRRAGARPDDADLDEQSPATGSSPTRCGSSARSSTRSTSAASSTPTTTAPATCAAIQEKLDYLQWLGVDCIWLLPMYASPLRDGGYDIADFYAVHPDYGTVEDFRSLVEAAHERGIRVIADLVVNHTSSSDHPWFQESRSSRDIAEARLVRLVGHRRALPGRADHLHRHRAVELDVGPGRRRSTTGTASSRTSPTSTTTTPRCRRRCSTCCASGSTSASTASGSTPCPTSTSATGRTARTCRRRTSS